MSAENLVNVHLFDILPAILSGNVRKSRVFFCLESDNLVEHILLSVNGLVCKLIAC